MGIKLQTYVIKIHLEHTGPIIVLCLSMQNISTPK